MVTLINHVGNSFDVSRMEISALKTSRCGKKFEDKELEALLKDQSQTQKELAESLGVIQQAVSAIESHGNDSKTRKLGVLTETERR